ncbi:hypothetical protein [Cohnella mopanensis]|uniref:hypothetical protein n=1 Tax=Cohnella mopanensis TaxID=2911966 RepID=UPI001EF87854|nr:hypothetical protein [Cohnella mopanensis]
METGSCYYHPSVDFSKVCVYCDKPLCDDCVHKDYPIYCWSCGLDFDNGNLAKKPKPFVIPLRLQFVRSKKFIVFSIAVLAVLLIYGIYGISGIVKAKQFKTKMSGIQFDGVHLFMSREEVGRLYGLGTDRTAGCFGCELNFIFPNVHLSGRYSETLNPYLVKMMTTTDPANSLFGFKVGDTFDVAEESLAEQGFNREGSDHRYVKDLYYVQLWNDGYLNDFDKHKDSKQKDEIIRSITIGYRVKKDEEIQY